MAFIVEDYINSLSPGQGATESGLAGLAPEACTSLSLLALTPEMLLAHRARRSKRPIRYGVKR